MQFRTPLPALLIAAVAATLIADGSAWAQAKPKRRVIPPSRPAVDLTVPVSMPSAPGQSPAPIRLGGLTGMTPVGDAAPACRAQCSKDRYTCHAVGDPTDCDSRWIPCLQACSAR